MSTIIRLFLQDNVRVMFSLQSWGSMNPGEWALPLVKQVCELGTLKADWNSYGAQPINPEIAASTIRLLLKLLSPGDPLPSIVPTSRGGVMLEWHEGGVDLEIDIRSPTRIHVAFEDDAREDECDSADLAYIADKLRILRGRMK